LASKWKPTDGSNLVKVACGRRHTITLDEFGRVYTLGENKYGQLGRLSTEAIDVVQGPLGKKNSGCYDIVCGWSHNIALCNNSVYAWGRNDKGQLGFIPSKDKIINEPLFYADLSVSKACCGSESSYFLLNNTTIWSCGWNEHGNLGTQDFKNSFELKELVGAKIQKPQGKGEILFSAGGAHLITLMASLS